MTRQESYDRSDSAQGILGSSAVMAAGTVVSRLTGFARAALLAAALGPYLHADIFMLANTIPNMLYILLAGGVFNAVLVPQLVRAMQRDDDGGEAFTNRVITLAGLFLAGVTAVLVIAAPWVMRVFLNGAYFTPALAEQRESVIDFARFCLPQVFFYGMFVLVGQILNARRRFGPMMWAPIANNVISVAVLAIYLLVFGPAQDLLGGYAPDQELLLGLGATAGIVAQFLVLLPYLRAAGFRYRPRFDFRNTGLAHTLRLGSWTVGFVVVNQIAYTVVVRLASGGTAQAVTGGTDQATGTGYAIYQSAFLLIMVPHAVATVSLATAVLPRLSHTAAQGDLPALGGTVANTLRTALCAIVPFAVLLPVVSREVTKLVFGYGAAQGHFADYAVALTLFAPGLVFFTCHYLMLRGFYAMERTRTVFWVQCWVAGTNIALAYAFTALASAAHTAAGLVLAYGGAYLVGAVLSYAVLSRSVGGLHSNRLVRLLVRVVLAAAIAAGAAACAVWLLHQVWPPTGEKPQALAVLVVAGLVDVALFLGLTKVMRVQEVTGVIELVFARLRR